jgi:hypothetical protein
MEDVSSASWGRPDGRSKNGLLFAKLTREQRRAVRLIASKYGTPRWTRGEWPRRPPPPAVCWQRAMDEAEQVGWPSASTTDDLWRGPTSEGAGP